MGRAPCCDKTKVKKGPWSPEEDETLKNYIQDYGIGGNWITLPQKSGLKRCGKSCRLRWLNYLRPDIKHGGFNEEEDSIICSLYDKLGSRWSIIASHLSGRTDNDVKNYWNTKLKKKYMLKQDNKVNQNPNLILNNEKDHDKNISVPSFMDSEFNELLVAPNDGYDQYSYTTSPPENCPYLSWTENFEGFGGLEVPMLDNIFDESTYVWTDEILMGL